MLTLVGVGGLTQHSHLLLQRVVLGQQLLRRGLGLGSGGTRGRQVLQGQASLFCGAYVWRWGSQAANWAGKSVVYC